MPYQLEIPKTLIDEQLLDVETARTALGCGRSTVYRTIEAGTLTSERIGGGRFMRWADICGYAARTGAVLQTGPQLSVVVLEFGALTVGGLADELLVSASIIERAVNDGHLVSCSNRRYDPRFNREGITAWFDHLRAAEQIETEVAR